MYNSTGYGGQPMFNLGQAGAGGCGSDVLLIAPQGPPRPWLCNKFGAAATSAARTSAALGAAAAPRASGCNVSAPSGLSYNPNGYEALWNGGEPFTAPPSWNPLLLQGNTFIPMGLNSPKLSGISCNSAFGRRKRKFFF